MFTIDQRVRELRPDATLRALVARGLRNAPSDDASRTALAAAVASLPADPLEHPHLAAWRETYRSFGAKPQRTPSSAEALRKRALTGSLPAVNVLVDLYNAVSVRHAVPVGGEDLAAVKGTIRLVRADGTEPFDTVRNGEPVVESPEPGEVVWIDDLGVTCRRWNWRQCRRTALTELTVDGYFLFESVGGYDLTPAVEEMAAHLRAWSPSATVSQVDIT